MKCARCQVTVEFCYDPYDLPPGVEPAVEYQGEILCAKCYQKERSAPVRCKYCGTKEKVNPLDPVCPRCRREEMGTGICAVCGGRATYVATRWVGGESYINVRGSVVHSGYLASHYGLCDEHAHGKENLVPLPDHWEHCSACGSVLPRTRGLRAPLGVQTFERGTKPEYYCSSCARILLRPEDGWKWKGDEYLCFFSAIRTKSPQDPLLAEQALQALARYTKVWGEMPEQQ